MAEKILTPKGEPKAVGLHGLIEEFNLKVPPPAVRSEVISGARRTTVTDGTVLEQYPKGYLPVGVIGNLRFAMRYEPIDLSALAAVFGALDIAEFQNWIRSEPTGIFARRAWYLFELLTGKTLDIPDIGPASYVDLLDSDLHITGAKVQVRRQRVNDNLLGNRFYCPLVRRTEALKNFMAKDLARRGPRHRREVRPGNPHSGGALPVHKRNEILLRHRGRDTEPGPYCPLRRRLGKCFSVRRW